jgi:hypothetical protein
VIAQPTFPHWKEPPKRQSRSSKVQKPPRLPFSARVCTFSFPPALVHLPVTSHASVLSEPPLALNCATPWADRRLLPDSTLQFLVASSSVNNNIPYSASQAQSVNDHSFVSQHQLCLGSNLHKHAPGCSPSSLRSHHHHRDLPTTVDSFDYRQAMT